LGASFRDSSCQPRRAHKLRVKIRPDKVLIKMAKMIADDFLNNLKVPASVRVKASKKAKEGYVMALVEAGEISSGRAGKILGVSRLEILKMMGKWGISVFDDSQNLEELSQELEQAESILAQQDS
jgi:predicted HTH domain antitoxin